MLRTRLIVAALRTSVASFDRHWRSRGQTSADASAARTGQPAGRERVVTKEPPLKKPMSLRSTLAAVTILVIVLAVLVSGALVALTTILHRSTERSAAAAESVHLAEETEVDLLL